MGKISLFGKMKKGDLPLELFQFDMYEGGSLLIEQMLK